MSPGGKCAPGRPAGATGDRTRERILNAALAIFARQGMAGTSVRDIARQARIHHFASKDALYQEVQERVHGQVRELVVSALGQGLDLRETTRAAVGALFGRGLDDPELAGRVRDHVTAVALRTLGLE